MKFSLLLAFASWAALVHATSIPQLGRRCEGAEVINTETIDGLVFTTFSCTGNSGDGAIPNTRSVESRDVTPSMNLFSRQITNCQSRTDPGCECGIVCNLFCQPSSMSYPNPTDCGNLRATISNIPGSFFLASQAYITASDGTCEVGFYNKSPDTIEYCYSNIAANMQNGLNTCYGLFLGSIAGCQGGDNKFLFEMIINGGSWYLP